jgi:hypothetical protein
MTVVVVLAIVFILVVKWRVGHQSRRRSEAEGRQLMHRPLGEFDARFPADRLERSAFKRRGRRRRGF